MKSRLPQIAGKYLRRNYTLAFTLVGFWLTDLIGILKIKQPFLKLGALD